MNTNETFTYLILSAVSSCDGHIPVGAVKDICAIGMNMAADYNESGNLENLQMQGAVYIKELLETYPTLTNDDIFNLSVILVDAVKELRVILESEQ
jgi:hypothetical protein